LQRERLEIDLLAQSPQAVSEVLLVSKDRAAISYSDLGQRIQRVEVAWRGVLALTIILLLLIVREPVLKLVFRKKARQLAVDKDFLIKCFVEEQHSLKEFDRQFQATIYQGTDRYLNLIEAAIRDRLKTDLIKYEILKRALTLPRLGRSLRRGINLFVAQFCVGFLRRAYRAARETAKGEKAGSDRA
jgi:hypothetical protein